MNTLMKSAAVVLGTLMALSTTARFAAADPILVTSGSLQMGASTGAVSIQGERGFTLDATVGVFDSFFAPWSQCLLPCAPGTTSASMQRSWGPAYMAQR